METRVAVIGAGLAGLVAADELVRRGWSVEVLEARDRVGGRTWSRRLPNGAVAEMGAHHHELHGHMAFAAWLGIHAYLMSGTRQRVDAFVAWAWDFFGSSRASSIIDDPDAAQIDWGDEDEEDAGPEQ